MRRTKPYMEGFHDPEEKPMEMQSRPSGLVVPKPPPEPPPHRPYGALEIQDPEAREKAKEGMNLLWDAMDLSSGGGRLMGRPVLPCDFHHYLYYSVGKALLGDDCPEREVLT